MSLGVGRSLFVSLADFREQIFSCAMWKLILFLRQRECCPTLPTNTEMCPVRAEVPEEQVNLATDQRLRLPGSFINNIAKYKWSSKSSCKMCIVGKMHGFPTLSTIK